MAYSRKFTEKKYLQITSILEELQALQEGEILLVRDLVGEDVLRVRWLLYDWLRHQGLKRLFTIRTEGNTLKIKKKPEWIKNLRVISAPLNKESEKLLEQTFVFSDKKKVKAFLVIEGTPEELQEQILERWEKVMA